MYVYLLEFVAYAAIFDILIKDLNTDLLLFLESHVDNPSNSIWEFLHL